MPPKWADTMPCGQGRKGKRSENGKGVQAPVPDADDNDGPAPVYVPIFPKLTSLSLEESLDFNNVVLCSKRCRSRS